VCRQLHYEIAWARAYNEQQLTRGNKHHIAVKALAFKWLIYSKSRTMKVKRRANPLLHPFERTIAKIFGPRDLVRQLHLS
jgi:hypothetical protein